MDTSGKMSQQELIAARRAFVLQSPRSPVTVFHHIPKCGGTSIADALANWFLMVPDYGSGWTDHYPRKRNIGFLRAAHCLCGHFEIEGNHLHQRYPEVLTSDRYRVISFVRDPLQVKLSLYRYEMENNVGGSRGIEEHLLSRPNYIADRFPATLNNYRETINRYFMVGILEEGQASLDVLARMMGKPRVLLPWKNSTNTDKNTEMENISAACLEKFREDNALDYLIYNYCADKLKRTIAENAAVKYHPSQHTET